MIIRGIIYAVLAAFCFGVMPILAKLVYGETGVDPFFFLMIRYVLAAMISWAYLLVRHDREYQRVDGGSFGWILAASGCFIVVTSTYFIALKYIDASLNSLLTFTFPVMTPLLVYLLFKLKPSWVQILAAMVGFIGCGFLIGNYHFKGNSLETLGIGLGLCSGLAYAFYTIFGQKATQRVAPLTVTTINITIVSSFFIILRVSWLWTNHQPLMVFLVAGILAVVSTILANTFYFEAIKAVGAVKAGIFSSFEPLFTTVLACIFLGERLSAWQWFGAFLILNGIIIVQRPWEWQRR